MSRPVLHGASFAVTLTMLILAPTLLSGGLERVLEAQLAVFLLPAFTLLAVPAGIAANIAAKRYATRKETWRFLAGMLLGGTLAGAALLMVGFSPQGSAIQLYLAERGIDGGPIVHLITALFGGVFILGFWLWLGGFLGAAAGYEKREKGEPEDDAVDPETANATP